jgi:Putative stage IV sporulation protein YqfD.
MLFLEEQEIKKGIPLKKVDTELLEKEIRKTFPEITWISVYLDGNSLTLDIKENDKPIPGEETAEEKVHKEGFLEEETGMDICANKAGTVVSIITREGTPLVQVGDETEVGDVLIRGEVEIFDNEGNVRESVKVHADGDVILESNISTSFEIPLMKTVKTETGNCKKYTFCRYGDRYRIWHLFSIPYEDYQAVPHTYSRTGETLGFTLEFGEMEIREVVKVVREKTEEEYTKELSDKLEEYVASLSEKAIQIKGKNVRIKKNANTVTMTGTLKAQGPFVERKETEIREESSDDTVDE